MSPTSDYLSFVLSFPKLTPMSILSLFFLALMRIAPVVAIAPFLGSKLPVPVKMGLAISIAVILLPTIIATSSHTIDFSISYIGYSLKELFIGLILAMMASFPFYVAESSGVLIDFLRGSSALMVTDPLLQNQVSPIGVLYNYVLIVLFYQIGGPFLFFEGVLETYKIIPADSFLSPAFFSQAQPFWESIASLLTKFTALSFQLAAPALVAILMGELFLGIANRMAPQVQIAFLGMAIKSLLGIGLLLAGWFFILQQLGKQALIWLNNINTMFRLFQI